MKKKVLINLLVVLAVSGLLILSCSMSSGSGGLKCSVQINNQALTRVAITDEDEVELYIETFAYIHETSPKWIIIVANLNGGMTDVNGKQIINDGWFSVKATEWVNQASHTSGYYSAIMLDITKLKVNGKEYSFGKRNVLYGYTHRSDIGQPRDYIDKFQGITMTDRAIGLKTILTVDPDILGAPFNPGYDKNGLADDPFEYITIKGIVE